MKKKPKVRTILGLVAVIGAFHVVLFGMHPKLPPKPEIKEFGAAPSGMQASLERPGLADTSLCSSAPVMGEEAKADTVISQPIKQVTFTLRPVAEDFRHTGDAVQVDMARGSSINLGDQSYPLRAIRFRAVDSKGHEAFDLIHRDSKHLIVVTVPLEVAEQNNPAIEGLWRYLPKVQGDHNALDDIHLDIDSLLPANRHYYRLVRNGACGPNVLFLGLDEAVSMSAKQAAKLEKVLHGTTMARSF